jgi:hypothetical protein
MPRSRPPERAGTRPHPGVRWGGPKFTEKAIYTEARQKDLIDNATRDEIIDLYGMTWVSSSVR